MGEVGQGGESKVRKKGVGRVRVNSERGEEDEREQAGRKRKRRGDLSPFIVS